MNNAPESKSDLEKASLALDEVRSFYQKNDADADHMDEKAASLLSSSSLILTLFGVMQIVLIKPTQTIVYQIMLGFIFLLFLALVGLVLYVQVPRKRKTVFVENWEGVEKAILNKKSEKEAIEQLIANYLDRINKNQAINEEKAKWLHIASIIFAGLMAMIVLLSMFSMR
jgi:hypothetical protein